MFSFATMKMERGARVKRGRSAPPETHQYRQTERGRGLKAGWRKNETRQPAKAEQATRKREKMFKDPPIGVQTRSIVRQ